MDEDREVTAQPAPYYLPLTRTAAERFLDRGEVPALVVERAALYAMFLASQAGAERGKLSRSVADADQAFASISKEQVEEFLLERRADLPYSDVAILEGALQGQAILFATVEQMASRAWCAGNGRYAEAFQDHCRVTLIDYAITAEPESQIEDADELEAANVPARKRLNMRGTSDQVRAALAIAGTPDEHFHMTAYAGSGKTHLLLALGESGRRFTHLAPTQHQQFAFAHRGGSAKIESLTQRDLAQRMVAELIKLRGGRNRPPRVYESKLPLNRQADIAGIPSIAGKKPADVLIIVLKAIRFWCHGDEASVGARHFRDSSIAPTDNAAFVALAERLWELMLQPLPVKATQVFTLRIYHLVKWLDLVGAEIPPLGTILVDEAHDLQSPWRALLNRYQDGWLIMGDPYQRLSAGKQPQTSHAKALTMIQSVRTGEQAMPLIRAVLNFHSERLVGDPILGSREHITRPRRYAKTDELPQSGLRVYGTEWQLLEDALRLKDAGAAFYLVPASARQLEKSVQDVVALRQGSYTPQQFHLRNFKTWDALAAHLVNIGQGKIARLFERNFGTHHLGELFDSQTEQPTAQIALGLLEHCKSLESSVVAMSQCCFESHSNVAASKDSDTLVKAVYVSMTRVRDELWLPGDAMARLEDQVRQGASSGSGQ